MIGTDPAASLSVTIDDVAKAAGVSIRTVSRVLNDSPKVGGETRDAVQAIIKELGYSPAPALALWRRAAPISSPWFRTIRTPT